MGKQTWKGGNMLYPLPAVMVSTADQAGNANIITVAWAGTVCTNPPMVSISVRPERYSYHMLKETGEFVINLTTRELVYACDFCGVTSGRDVDKFEKTGLTKLKLEKVQCPAIAESPVNIACKVREIRELGSHTMFIADVVSVTADEKYIDESGKFCLNDAELVCYSHGEYFQMGEKLGSFGYSIRKKKQNIEKQSREKHRDNPQKEAKTAKSNRRKNKQ